MNFDLAGRIALVTGGANGIGLATAVSLKKHGATVDIFDVEQERPDETAKQIGGRSFPVDITHPDAVLSGFEKIGTPDIVVINAGIASEAGLLEHTLDQWDRVLAMNLTGAFVTLQTAAG
jgi:NAD(P)-dependent dehydrogenase (short-subunit alcohol dehydrogenase family)